jgi:hypothetical protein
MSVTVRASSGAWVHVHRAALLIVVLGMALAATLGLLVARIVPASPSVPGSSVSTVHLTPTDNGCQIARPGGPC